MQDVLFKFFTNNNFFVKVIMFMMAFSLVVADVNASAVQEDFNKWHPGIYTKIEDWQLQSPKQMEQIYQELADTPQLRGIKVTMQWGRYETRDVSTGKSTYNFSEIDTILARLAALDKYLILDTPWKSFKSVDGASKILPNDMQNGVLWSDDPNWEHIDYDYLWAYKKSKYPGQYKYAYNLKLWDPMVISRFDAYMEALAAHVDNHPNFIQISTTESAIGKSIIPFVAGESRDLQFAGQLAILRIMKKYFIHSMTMADLNFDRDHVASAVPVLEQEAIGFGSPNSNKNEGIIITGPHTAPGVLNYYPKLSGKLVLAPEIQGDDFRGTYGPGSPNDYPSHDYLYKRVRDDLKANIVVIQRNFPHWLGGTIKDKDIVVPSMLEFIQTYPDIINDTTGAGGLDSSRPAMLGEPSPGLLPDVIVTSVSYDNIIGKFSATVKNQGDGATPDGISVVVSYLVDGKYKTWGRVRGPVPAGTSVSIGTNGDTYDMPVGSHQVTVRVDPANLFEESNETNNELTQQVIAEPSSSSPAPKPSLTPASGSGAGEVLFTDPIIVPTQTTQTNNLVTKYNFIRSLYIGIKGEDVKQLQRILNSDPDTRITTSREGSKGFETNFFGELTAEAVGKFQIKHGLLKNRSEEGYGQVGPRTLVKINNLQSLGGAVSTTLTTGGRIDVLQQIQELQASVQVLQQQLLKQNTY